jgi:hypothetical protein
MSMLKWTILLIFLPVALGFVLLGWDAFKARMSG